MGSKWQHVFTLVFGRQEQHTNQTDSNLHCQWRSPFQRNGKEREHAETCSDSPNRNRRSSGFLRRWRAHELPGATCQWPLRWLFQSWICQWYGGPGVQGTTIIIASSRSVCSCFWLFLVVGSSDLKKSCSTFSWHQKANQDDRNWNMDLGSPVHDRIYRDLDWSIISVQLIRESKMSAKHRWHRSGTRPSDEIIGDIHLRSWFTFKDVNHQELLSGSTANFSEFVRQKRTNMHAWNVFTNNITQMWPILPNTHFVYNSILRKPIYSPEHP